MGLYLYIQKLALFWLRFQQTVFKLLDVSLYIGCFESNTFCCICIETTTNTKSTTLLLDRANSPLQNTIFQYSHHHQMFCVDEWIKMLFILWCGNCAWLSRIQLVFDINDARAETQHPLPRCAHIHCLVSINVEQASVNVSGCHFFHMEEFIELQNGLS